MLVNDVAHEPRCRPCSPDVKPVGAELAVPMRRSDEVIGVLDIQALEPSAFDQEDTSALEALAEQIRKRGRKDLLVALLAVIVIAVVLWYLSR